jgi:hypothetical protein
MRRKVFRAYAVRTLLVAQVAATALGLAACGSDSIVDPPLPSDAEMFSPPTVYSTWWNMTQACSGLTGSLEAVTWYSTDEVLHDAQTGEVLNGYWSSASNRIVLVTDAVRDGGTVRHEMLHALLRQAGHPRSQFLGKCAGIVHCQGACIREAGPYPTPPESPVQVPGDGIDLIANVAPNNPTPGQDGGFFSIVVTAHNHSTHWVTVTPTSGVDPTSAFSFDVRSATTSGGITSQEIALDPSQTIFAPGETKTQVFDFVIGDDAFANQLLAGDYLFRGGFAGYWSSARPFTIGP